MKKYVLLVSAVLLSSLLYGCDNNISGVANASTKGTGSISISVVEPTTVTTARPKLHIVENDLGDRFLADENETLRYILSPPHVTIDFDRMVIEVNTRTYYAPGTTYYNSVHDGITVGCGGGPHSGVKGVIFEFGQDGGEFEIPKLPISNCSFQSFVIDGEGTKFTTNNSVLFIKRQN